MKNFINVPDTLFTYPLMDFTLPKLLCIYIIINKVTGDFYVGSARGERGLQGRFKLHRSQLLEGDHHSGSLQEDYDEYGKESFCINVIEICEKELCLEREQYYLDNLDHFYNSAKKARGGGSPRPESMKGYLSDLYSKECEIYCPIKGLIKIKNITRFCDDNNLSRDALRQITRAGGRSRSQGYFASKEAYEEYMEKTRPKEKFYGLYSIFRGVAWHKESQKWNGRVKVKGVNRSAGYYINEKDAAEAALIARQVYGVS